MFFGPAVDSAQTMNRDNIAADWFDSDTSMTAVHHIEIYGENASVFGVSTTLWTLHRQQQIPRHCGPRKWQIGVEALPMNDWRTSTSMLMPRTESDARGKYWDMYRHHAQTCRAFARDSALAQTTVASPTSPR